MPFSLADVFEAAERLARGTSRDDLADAQRAAMREDSIPSLLRDFAAETLSSIARRLRGRS
jgi:hypothetical protein